MSARGDDPDTLTGCADDQVWAQVPGGLLKRVLASRRCQLGCGPIPNGLQACGQCAAPERANIWKNLRDNGL
jgi:hypothetical protein